VNPYVIEILGAHGITWAYRTPIHIDAVADERFQLVPTVCDNARDARPYFPGAAVQVHCGLLDPTDETGPTIARRAFAATYDALAARIDALLALPLETLSTSELREQVQAIHTDVRA